MSIARSHGEIAAGAVGKSVDHERALHRAGRTIDHEDSIARGQAQEQVIGERIVRQAGELVSGFEKRRYVDAAAFAAGIHNRGRSRIRGRVDMQGTGRGAAGGKESHRRGEKGGGERRVASPEK